jgi:hypothetical protein
MKVNSISHNFFENFLTAPACILRIMPNLQPSDRVNRQRNWETGYRSLEKTFRQTERCNFNDKAGSAITSTKPRDIPVRRFFLGEIFGVSDSAGRRRFRVKSLSPWLVTRKQSVPGQPVLMAPSSKFPREQDWVFSTAATGTEVHFLLYYRKPVFRELIGDKMGALNGLEKQQLVAEFHRVLGAVA